jgi:hypothetical protein
MKKQIISEQTTQQVVDAKGVVHDGILDLVVTYCKPKMTGFTGFDYSYKHPNGKEVLSFKRPDGGFNWIMNKDGQVWFEKMDTSGKVTTDGFIAECQSIIGAYVPPTITKEQENAMVAYTTNHKGTIKEKPVAAIIRDYTPIDMNTIDPKLFPTPKLIYVYQHSSLAGIEPDQLAALKNILKTTNWSIDIPEIGTAENAAGVDAIQKIKELGLLTVEVKKVLDGANAKRATSTIPDERTPLKIYPIKTEGNSEVDMVTSIQDLDKDIKSKVMSRQACRKTIKFLSKKSKEMNGNGYRTSDVDPKMLANARQFAQSCVTQGTKFLGGILGINDEIKDLQECRNPWCLGQPCPTGQSYDGKRKRCRGTQTNESTRKLQILIRESLIETKKTKERNVLSEGKIVKARLSIISENVSLKTKKQKDKFFDELLSEMTYLNSQGFDKKIINEGFWDTLKGLFGHAPDGIMEYFKEYIAKWLVEHLTPMDSNGWLGSIVITAIGNLPIGDIPKLTDCNFLTKLISKSVAEGTVRKLTHEKGLEGPFYDILRNSIVDMLDETSLGSKIEEALGSFICPLLGGVKNKMNVATDTLKQKALATS